MTDVNGAGGQGAAAKRPTIDSPSSQRTNSVSSHSGTGSNPTNSEKDKQREDSAFRSDSSSPLLDTEPLPMDDHSNCPYCHKQFRKPRVLDCLHSMCEDCIIAQLDGRRDPKTLPANHNRKDSNIDCELEVPKERPTPPGVIRCPICAQESHVGNDVRYVHLMLLDYVRIEESEESQGLEAQRRCRACKSEQPSVAVCKQCQSDLCSNCLIAHSQMRMFDGHVTKTYAELEQLGQTREVRPVLCPSHSQVYKMFCMTCEALACKVCLENEHGPHKVVEVDRVTLQIQDQIKKLADSVERKWTNSMNEWNSVPDHSASLHNQYENAKAKIELVAEDLQRLIEEVKVQKLAELEEIRHTLEQNIEDLYRKINVNESRVNDALSFTRRLLEKTNGMETLASRKKVMQQLNNLLHTMPALNIQVEIEFATPTRKQMEENLARHVFGNVVGQTLSNPKDRSTESTPPASATISRMSQESMTGSIGGIAGNEWTRTTSVPNNLGAIGGERNKKAAAAQANQNGGSGSRDGSQTATARMEPFGWPPSSNPPELPPPKDLANPQQIQPPTPSTPLGGLLGSINPLAPSAPAVGTTNPPPFGLPPSTTNKTIIPPSSLAPSTNSMTNLPTAASIYNNYQWPGTATSPLDAAAAAELQSQLAAAAVAAGLGGTNAFRGMNLSSLSSLTSLQNSIGNFNNLALQQEFQKIQTAAAQQLLLQNNLATNPMMRLGNLSGLRGAGAGTGVDQTTAQALLGMRNLSLGNMGPGGVSVVGGAMDPSGGNNALVNAINAANMGTNQQRASPQEAGSRPPDLRIHSVFGTSQQGSTIRELHCPSGFCLSENDDILIADTNNHRIIVCGPPHPWKIGRPGTDDGQLCFPRKVVALRGADAVRYVVLDKGVDGKTRAQIFNQGGEFVKRINMTSFVPRGGIEVAAATCTNIGQLVLVDSAGMVYCIGIFFNLIHHDQSKY
ncbi:hypothetical protein WR25_20288 isoform B [Diploscapter pachys]|uniref:B box-type domain-containing protein n=1 Tax=Diploscapter pachys TaxID=2018661 RepID=A0A2A2LP84_9BILA|nr:hypothetical protein WR25_20288 isoform B [Diploscapter pachys]